MTIHLCMIDYDTLEDRGDCPNALHDWPLPDAYVAAHEVAMSRISQGWRQKKCPKCGLYGWPDPPKPMRGTAKNPVRVPAAHPNPYEQEDA